MKEEEEFREKGYVKGSVLAEYARATGRTVDEVRALMITKAKEGGEGMMDKQRQLLSSMSYTKLSDVPPERLVVVRMRPPLRTKVSVPVEGHSAT